MGTTEIKENKDIEVVENAEVVEEAEVVEDAEATEDVQEIKPYTLRNPKATDIAAFLKLFHNPLAQLFADSLPWISFSHFPLLPLKEPGQNLPSLPREADPYSSPCCSKDVSLEDGDGRFFL